MINSLEVPLSIETDCHDLGDWATLSRLVRQAVTATLHHCGFTAGLIGVLLTDDESIHQINLQHLAHDYPTDVISFSYQNQPPYIEGELVASVETARREAHDLGLEAINELLMYVIHGTLHICGLDDQNAAARNEMRFAEREILSSLGIFNAAEFDPDAQSRTVEIEDSAIHSDLNYR